MLVCFIHHPSCSWRRSGGCVSILRWIPRLTIFDCFIHSTLGAGVKIEVGFSGQYCDRQVVMFVLSAKLESWDNFGDPESYAYQSAESSTLQEYTRHCLEKDLSSMETGLSYQISKFQHISGWRRIETYRWD